MNISFVMPCYNAEKWIRQSIEGVIRNMEEGDEFIIVHDCSTDNTGRLLSDFVKIWPQLKIIHNSRNLGCPASRNIGFGQAQNEILCNVDADNILIKRSIKRLKKYMLDQGADMAHFREIHFFKETMNALTHIWKFKSGRFTINDFFAGHYNPGPAGNFLHTKSGWVKVGGYDEFDDGTHEAWCYTMKRLFAGSYFVISPKDFYYHRHGNNSLFTRGNWEKNSIKITNDAINRYLQYIDPDDRFYIEDNRDKWFYDLPKSPIKLAGTPVPGRNGEFIKC